MKTSLKGWTGIFACLAIAASISHAAGFHYLGPGAAPGSARVRLDDGRVAELRAGERSEIGDVVSADDDEMIVEQVVSEEERERYRESGDVVPDLKRIHVHRDPPAAAEVSLESIE